MQDFEKLGVFYLGKILDSNTGKPTDELLLYDSKDLTTHAVCLGMTGSGKTGLGITILEEAAIDKIPAIIIDPKGDLGNLLLTFPHLSPEEFLPWVDPAEAQRKGEQPDAYAAEVAKTWKDGLAKWGEDEKRIQRLRNSVDMIIYTPANNAGVPISIMSSFAAPTKEQMQDTGAIRDRIVSVTSSLLGLLGIEADPIKSKEHILISSIIEFAWKKGENLDIASLIQYIQKPPFDKVGVLDIDTFYSSKDRQNLSVSLNNLLASPGFQAWMEGEPLDIQKILYTKEGKPRLSIFSIAHLSDSERMFFVTLLLNEFISWMRKQSGTSSLRALLYMDEIFGYFPPIAAPPSKLPMLTLLKQARAFGVGVVLATQNPVDLDYKGLSNCGTWFIGKLQTERDKARVVEGLKTASNGDVDMATLDKMLALTGSRTFIMRSVYEKDPILFQTRWSLSYLRGPLTLPQISLLTDKTAVLKEREEAKQIQENKPINTSKPNVPGNIQEFFVSSQKNKRPHYKPEVVGIAKLHYVEVKNKIDEWEELCIIAPVTDGGKDVAWDEGKNMPEIKSQLDTSPSVEGTYEELPAGLIQEKNYSGFTKGLAASLYQNHVLTIYSAPEIGLISNPGESEGDYKIRLSLALREKRDSLVKELRDKYAGKIAALTDKIRVAQEKSSEKHQRAGRQFLETLISFGTTILGAVVGRGATKGTITSAGTSLRKAGRISKENQEAERAEQDCSAYQAQLNELQDQLNVEIAKVSDINSVKIDTIPIRPRKSDIFIDKVALVWIADDILPR